MRSSWGGRGRYEGGSWLPFNWYQIPATRNILLAVVLTFLAYFLAVPYRSVIGQVVAFDASAWLARPWTWFTYPLLELPSFWFLLTAYVFYSFGGMLERSWGSRNFAVLFFAFTAVGALAFVPAYYLLQVPVQLLGLLLPLNALVTAWAALDPELEVSFWGVPVKAKFLALVWVLLTYFQMGLGPMGPVGALFSLAAPIAAFIYVRKLPRLNLDSPFGRRNPYADLDDRPPPLLRNPAARRGRPAPRESVGGFNPLRRRQEQQEIERLRKLLGDDDEPLTRH
jgi:membrane associated rhomboid family serine protease